MFEQIDETTGEITTAKSYRKDKVRFTKMYEKGLNTITALAGTKSTLRVYMFIIEHCGYDNALVCTVDLIADELGISKRTVLRATKDLEDQAHIAIAKIGTGNAYILNDEEFWKTYEESKRFSSFRARTLVSAKDNKALKKRLTHMIGGPQPDLFEEEEQTPAGNC